ncbi:DUF916 and DUF3324 domain-containing protein [Vagococcus sp. BWB3-3]|uniref:DUF916 and DUF3324 domain-containing protein n=1 Tax=Vagococcus allomyrinae TaxID=2794353 RepID=A0A940SV83_9ENTE|nr:DUF916 and DUF3324 domain-containing protein [Vagococcus allomyrinae]MBP1040078.1 DUF916 and DUF3324 domain-containing protein [Vagococcus allomyrinae]
MRKMKLTFRLVVVMIAVMVVGMMPKVAKADSSPIAVKAILPENQFKKDVSFYYLKMSPGAKQEIELQLFNSSDQEVTAEVGLSSATTNDNGLIDYNLMEKEIDKSLLFPFPSIASTPKEVKVPAQSDVKTKIQIEMPAEEYDGMILGGVNVKTKKTEDKQTEDKSSQGGMKIENEMTYSIGVVLIENEEFVKTDMKLNKVFASQIMGNNTTKATLQNPTSAVMEDVSIEAKVMKKGSSDVLYEVKSDGYRMAPNSAFDFGIPIGKERYRAGEYTLKLVAVSDPKDEKDGERQEWTFEEDFVIKREEADKLNAKAVDLPTDYTKWYIIGGVALLALILIIIMIVVIVKKKKQEQKRKVSKNKSKSKSKKRKK